MSMKNLDDVFELLNCDYVIFIDELDNALEALPITRESTETVLDAVDQFDIPELYNALFYKFESFLTEAEKKEIITRYKRTFDLTVLPLPWWVEEDK